MATATNGNPLAAFRSAFDELLLLGNRDRKDFLDFIGVVTLGIFLPRHLERLWGYVCAPASSGKTEALSVLISWKKYVVAKDYLTSKALVSGVDHGGERTKELARTGVDSMDPSLLPKLDGKLLVVKEMTTMLQIEAQRQTFYGTIRGAYDYTKYEAHSGTVGEQGYNSKFGVLAATTEDALDRAIIGEQAAGERFICLRLQEGANPRSLDHRISSRVFDSRDHKREVRAESKRVAIRALTEARDMLREDYTTDRPLVLRKILTDAARLTCMLRTQPGKYGPVSSEKLSRLLNVLIGICDIRSIASGRRVWNNYDVRLARRVCWDTLPRPSRKLLLYLLFDPVARGSGVDLSTVGRVFHFPRDYGVSILSQWRELRVVDCDGKGRWKIRGGFVRNAVRSGLVPGLHE